MNLNSNSAMKKLGNILTALCATIIQMKNLRANFTQIQNMARIGKG
eukprot:CAMPEP_0194107816 /NCGR_PEP_ID=MMETSP0150-20130528/7623_1 /TAXON_ID=122233 /ORGANISM="Chaetoceros debilis, Strain MM31A-1" /LENGTH=45 /DNA_ID= /DNA_START= /DNA_END= /DNA_ORIENTATION=